MTIIGLIVWLVILGFIAWLVSIAPMINAQFKQIITFVLIVIAAILVLSFLLGLAGTSVPSIGGR